MFLGCSFPVVVCLLAPIRIYWDGRLMFCCSHASSPFFTTGLVTAPLQPGVLELAARSSGVVFWPSFPFVQWRILAKTFKCFGILTKIPIYAMFLFT